VRIKVDRDGRELSFIIPPLRQISPGRRQLKSRLLGVAAGKAGIAITLTNRVLVTPLELWEIGERMKALAERVEPAVGLFAPETLPEGETGD